MPLRPSSDEAPEKRSGLRSMSVPGRGLSSSSHGRWIVVAPGMRFQSQPSCTKPLSAADTGDPDPMIGAVP